MNYYISWLIASNEIGVLANGELGLFGKLQQQKKDNPHLYKFRVDELKRLLRKQKAERLYYEKCAWVERSNGNFVRFPIVGMWLDGVPSKPCLCRDADTGKEYGVILSTHLEKRGFNIL